MKKNILLLIILLTLGITSLHAQITFRESKVIEKAVLKPKAFDSLSNLEEQKRPIDCKKYIGYKLFFRPRSKNYKPKFDIDNKEQIIDFLFSTDTIEITKEGKIPFDETGRSKLYKSDNNYKSNYNDSYEESLEHYNERKRAYDRLDKEQTDIYKPHFYYEGTDSFNGEISGKIGTSPDSLYGKYFTIIDIKGKNYRDPKEKKYEKLEDIDLESSRMWELSLNITLRNESNKDTLYCKVRHQRLRSDLAPFFLVPYFEKQRNMYLNQNVMLKYDYTGPEELRDLVDVNTGAIINIKYGEVWTCSDISFVDSKDSYYLSPFYFLKNGDREVKIKLGTELVTKELLNNYFMLETEFKQRKLEKQKKEEQIVKEEQERRKEQEREKIKFKNNCIAKWGQKMGGYIADGKVILGMNKEMCTAAWGSPIDVNRTIVRGLKSEQWVYGWGTYLYFENGVLSAIQD